MEELKYVIFRLGDQKYGMSLAHINGIEQDYHIIPVPNAPEGIKGIINLRGAVIPVYSLRQQFGMDGNVEGAERSLLITVSSGTYLAYEVDEVITIEEVVVGDLNIMPRIVANDDNVYLDTVLHIGKEIVVAINVDRILSDDVKQQVQNFVEESSQQDKD